MATPFESQHARLLLLSKASPNGNSFKRLIVIANIIVFDINNSFLDVETPNCEGCDHHECRPEKNEITSGRKSRNLHEHAKQMRLRPRSSSANRALPTLGEENDKAEYFTNSWRSKLSDA